MPKIQFEVRPYRDYKGDIMREYFYLALVTESGEILTKDSLDWSRWKRDESYRTYWKHKMLSEFRDYLEPLSKGESSWRTTYLVEDNLFNEWYKWEYYIEGEDAHEFIRALGKISQHTTDFTTRYGLVLGWKYYKVLKKHDFLTSTSAMLAYARGYLGAMEAGRPFDREGLEALHCLGLEVKEGFTLTELGLAFNWKVLTHPTYAQPLVSNRPFDQLFPWIPFTNTPRTTSHLSLHCRLSWHSLILPYA